MKRKILQTILSVVLLTGPVYTAYAGGDPPTLEQLAVQVGALQTQVATLGHQLEVANARIKDLDQKAKVTAAFVSSLWEWAGPLMEVLYWYDQDPNVDPYIEIQADVRTTGSAYFDGLVVNGKSTLHGEVYWLPWEQPNNKNPSYYELSSIIYWADWLMPYLSMVGASNATYPTMRIQSSILLVKTDKTVFDGPVIGTGTLDWVGWTSDGAKVIMEVSNWFQCVAQSEDPSICTMPLHNP